MLKQLDTFIYKINFDPLSRIQKMYLEQGNTHKAKTAKLLEYNKDLENSDQANNFQNIKNTKLIIKEKY